MPIRPSSLTPHLSGLSTPASSGNSASSKPAAMPGDEPGRQRSARETPMIHSKGSKPSAVLQAAREVYRDRVVYHGTSQAGKASIRANGMRIDLKTAGATDSWMSKEAGSAPIDDGDRAFAAEAKKFNYLAEKKFAKDFAKIQQHGRPALVRVIPDEVAIDLDEDPDAQPGVFRTAQTIRKEFILPAKKSENYGVADGALTEFVDEMKDKGHTLNRADAAKILQEVQSDSDNDSD